ncbi:unnamed protein product [Larinioides sclopetarius]|uniref:Apolipo L3-like protein n=1 Tax=Larinioides sclopetarius TaxID=280406 RepID=A0AAV1Z124_9ARAC
MVKDALFQRVFGQKRRDSDLLISDDELTLASFVFDVAYDEINSNADEFDDRNFDTASVLSFDEKIETTLAKFDSIVVIFKRSFESQETFLKSFEKWAKPCQKTIESLRVFAEEMQTDKFNSDIARVVGGVVGTIGGILVGLSFLTPLAAVTVPLAIGGGVTSALGGGVVVGTTGTELVLVKNRLEKVKTLIEEEKERFSAMAHWFTHPEELENAINSLVDFDILTEILPEVQNFLEISEQKKMTDDEFKNEFKQILKDSLGKMNKDNKLKNEYGNELAPVVITFVFVVCLLKVHNRIVLDCVMITQRLALGLMSVLDLGVLAGSLIGKLAVRSVASTIAKFAVAEILTCLGIIIDVLNVVFSSIDLHKRPETKHTKKIKEVAEKFEKIFLFIEGVYNETKKYKSLIDESQWTTVVILHAPDDAGHEDFKIAIKQYLPEDGWRKMKIKRLETRRNNWLVKIPTIHSEMLLQQETMNIKGKNCVVTQ